MKLKQVEVSLSKEERRITDEYGNTASTWARIGFTAELVEGDDPIQAMRDLRELIQPQVDDWLLHQKQSYVPPTPEEIEEVLDEIEAECAAAETSGNDDDIPL
jgi:hypothetical protein